VDIKGGSQLTSMTSLGLAGAGTAAADGLVDAKLARLAQGAKQAGVPDAAKKRAEVREVAEQFESLFLNLVMKSMRDTIQKSGLIDGGNAENIYTSMLDDEYAKQMAAQHSTGLADSIAEFMLRTAGDQDGAQAAAAQAAGLKAYGMKARGASAGADALQPAAKRATMEVDDPAAAASALSSTLRPRPL
jgi:flagellar protein FlgJ